MSLPKSLASLSALQLKHAAFLLGLPSTGTKTDLSLAIQSAIARPPLFRKEAGRILSIDMGIKNLGICVLEAPLPHLSASATPTPQQKQTSAPLKVLAWERRNILPSSHPKDKPDPTPFRPSHLSTLATTLTTDLLKTHAPTHILIERQRFRSAGASAVLEWTLRVNMLESMLWASLATLRAQSRSPEAEFPDVYEVEPARVASFWCARPPGLGTRVDGEMFGDSAGKHGARSAPAEKGTGRRKVEKKDKIAVVRSWLAEGNGNADVALDFPTDEARRVAEAFVSEKKRGGAKAALDEKRLGKLDDLADCLLQGVAWVRWMENQRVFQRLLDGS